MTDYTVTFARSARKELEQLDRATRNRMLSRIEALAAAPRPSGCRKLVGSGELWRIRVGNYRVIYSIDDGRGIVDVVIIRHRRDAYR
jgi:mRNA interferase RelE/StbE